MARYGRLLFLLAALAPLCAGAGDGAAPGLAAIQVIDATPPFWAFWDGAQGKPKEERAQRFLDTVVAAHPELYGAGVLQEDAVTGTPRKDDAAKRISVYLEDVAPYIARMRALSASIDVHFHAYARDFSGTFPDFAPKSPVYFTISLFSFDGATREVNGKTALLFGIDAIARFHRPDFNLKILFDHELFHQYHDQIAPALTDDDAPLWVSIWEEGLATYVSQRMNPGSTVGQVLMFPPDLEERAEPKLGALARELLANLDSKDKTIYGSFFFARNSRADIPPRSGYYVGYRVATALGVDRDLRQLARLQDQELKSLVEAALRNLAAQP
jgi:hypothetical protein